MRDFKRLLNGRDVDVRDAAVRALGRMDSEHSKEAIRPLLEDPVHDVRKAAQAALRSPNQKTGKTTMVPPVRNADGTRSWTVGASNESSNADDNDWKARRSAITGT